jgi:hypothetical protein
MACSAPLWITAAYKTFGGLYGLELSVSSQPKPYDCIPTYNQTQAVEFHAGFLRHMLTLVGAFWLE